MYVNVVGSFRDRIAFGDFRWASRKNNGARVWRLDSRPQGNATMPMNVSEIPSKGSSFQLCAHS